LSLCRVLLLDGDGRYTVRYCAKHVCRDPLPVSHSVLATQAVYSAQLLISNCCRKALVGAKELVMGDVVDGVAVSLCRLLTF
jgi:hypothetical protein